jgi:hypothetical protein
MANIKIPFFNESTVLKDSDVKAAIAPLQTQATRDFAPVWGVDADLTFFPKGTQLPAKTWQIGIFDDSDQAGALGYHDLTGFLSARSLRKRIRSIKANGQLQRVMNCSTVATRRSTMPATTTPGCNWTRRAPLTNA